MRIENDNLTEREQEIYNEIVENGLTDKQISEKLLISLATVKTHLNNIYLKKFVNSRSGLIYNHYKKKLEKLEKFKKNVIKLLSQLHLLESKQIELRSKNDKN